MALAHQWNGSWGWANISAGARMTQTDLSPFDIGNERAGFRADAALGTDGALNLGESWRLSWYGEGGVRDESYLGRLETTRSMNAGQWRLGAEGIIQGDPTYRRTSAGAVGAVKFLKDFELRIALGASFQEGQDTEPYGSIGFSRLF
jgi:hypothetical protein